MLAKIWISVPHEVDGYFVELIQKIGKLNVQVDSTWCPTITACEAWARSKDGKVIIERFDSTHLK